MTWMVFILHP